MSRDGIAEEREDADEARAGQGRGPAHPLTEQEGLYTLLFLRNMIYYGRMNLSDAKESGRVGRLTCLRA